MVILFRYLVGVSRVEGVGVRERREIGSIFFSYGVVWRDFDGFVIRWFSGRS